jgi:hypothetical protein
MKKTSDLKKWRAGYELKPARQAKRKEADATGPQGGYGIRLAYSLFTAKGMPGFFPGPDFCILVIIKAS